LNDRLGRFSSHKYSPYQAIDTDGIEIRRSRGRDYFDLRGLNVSVMVNWLEFNGFDFSGGRFSFAGQFGPYAKFADCLFVGGKFNTNIRDEFANCDFSHAMMVGALLGSSFKNCVFERTDLRRAFASSSKFRDCRFEKANLRASDLFCCEFRNCVFVSCSFGESSLTKSKFIGGVLDGCDLSDAFTDGVEYADENA
jgi:uncharacterized protein YjbI with pentapeptide repeats